MKIKFIKPIAKYKKDQEVEFTEQAADIYIKKGFAEEKSTRGRKPKEDKE